MEITFLGTSAAEQYPGVWCTCDHCAKARALGGRNIRHNSAIHFGRSGLIDFPPEIVSQAMAFGVDLISAELLLLTHSHDDHFYPSPLHWRYRSEALLKIPESERMKAGYCRYQDLPTLHIYGSRTAYAQFDAILDGRSMSDMAIDFTIPRMYAEYDCAGSRFIPMTASHVEREGEFGMIYIVENSGKTFLYASDSGPYSTRTRECIAAHKYDAIIMEQTCGYLNVTDESNHMNWEKAMAEARFFEKTGLWRGEPRIYWTHMSPHRTPPHVDLEAQLMGTQIVPAYDGLRIEL